MRCFISGWVRETSEYITEPLRRSFIYINIILYNYILSSNYSYLYTNKSKYIKGLLKVKIGLLTAYRE
jgi:hypothetical protein